MSKYIGGGNNSVRLTHFWLDEWPDDLNLFARYVTKDHHFTVGYKDNGTFALRAHDEQRTGGYGVAATPSYVVDLPTLNPAVDDLPNCFPPATSIALVDLDLSAGDIDLSNWSLLPECESVQVRFRKVDNSANGVSYTDHMGFTYTFVCQRGEFITLIWDAATQQTYIV